MALHRSVIAALLCASSGIAAAQNTGEAEYLRVLRRAVSSFDTISTVYTTDQRRSLDSTLADLEMRLRSIIGPVHVAGFPQPPRINKDGLCTREVDCGMLDGLVLRTGDWSRTLVVTTPALMSAWLDDQRWNVGKRDRIESALQSADVMSEALGGNSMALHYADLPVADATARGMVSAMLVLRAQDFGDWPPRQVMVTVRRRDRIYIIQVPAAAEIATIPECSARLHSAFKAAFDTLPPSAPHMLSMKEEERVYALYRRCYAERLSTIPGIDRILRQVSDLVASLPE